MIAQPIHRVLTYLLASGVLPALVGCGESKGPTPTASAASPVNPDDPVAWQEFLRTIDVPLVPREDLGAERAGVGTGIFLVYPLGEIRKEGLRNARLDVTPDFDTKGTLRFSKGSKALHEVPFDPTALAKDALVIPIPAAVLDAVRTGDTVKWGVFFENRRVKDVVGSFVVVDKPAATRDIQKKVEANATLAAAPAVKALAKAEILLNYSLYAEVIQELTEAAALDKSLSAPYLPLAHALRRLKLKDSPLFHEAMSRAVAMKGGGASVEAIPARAGGPAPTPARAGGPGAAGKGLAPGGSVPPGALPVGPAAGLADTPASGAPAVTPAGTAAGPATAQASLAAALRRYDVLRRQVEEQLERARRLATNGRLDAEGLRTRADEARARALDLRQKAEALEQDLPAHAEDAAYGEKVVAAKQEADEAKAAAEQADLAAQRGSDGARREERRAADLAGALRPPVLPAPPTAPQVAPGEDGARARLALEAAIGRAETAEGALGSAHEALVAARQALDAGLVPPGTAEAPTEALLAAEEAYGQAATALAEALRAVEAAHLAHDRALREGR